MRWTSGFYRWWNLKWVEKSPKKTLIHIISYMHFDVCVIKKATVIISNVNLKIKSFEQAQSLSHLARHLTISISSFWSLWQEATVWVTCKMTSGHIHIQFTLQCNCLCLRWNHGSTCNQGPEHVKNSAKYGFMACKTYLCMANVLSLLANNGIKFILKFSWKNNFVSYWLAHSIKPNCIFDLNRILWFWESSFFVHCMVSEQSVGTKLALKLHVFVCLCAGLFKDWRSWMWEWMIWEKRCRLSLSSVMDAVTTTARR